MPTYIHVRVSKPSRSRDQERHDDEIPGWAAERKPKDEPQAKNLNLSLGRWIERALANSGPRIAPGTVRKSS